MELTDAGILNQEEWIQKQYEMPKFNRQIITENTKTCPEWIHFGAGNIFRAFQGNVVQRLLNQNILKTGLIVAEGYDYEIISKMYAPHDNLSILATLKANGTITKTVIASIVEALELNREKPCDFQRLQVVFQAPSLKMASFTITEKGYSLVNGKGEVLPDVANDFKEGPTKTQSYIGKVTSLLYTRYESGKLPIAMVSMDNCSHNGDKLYDAINTFAKKWVENGVCETGFLDYVNDHSKVSFPWTMIDKITPRPDDKVKQLLYQDQIDGLEQVITSKNTYVAPFVNAEECEYLVIEDHFPNGKLPLDKAGILYTDRNTVDQVEKMKVCTCLNPLHTSLAIFGCLLGYIRISKEMENPDLNALVKEIGYQEGLPVVVDPKIINPKTFIDEVVNIRIPNPFMPDTPQRIASDTSQKLSIRFGETIKAYLREKKDMKQLKGIAFVLAGWARYLMAVDDQGNAFTLSPDPLLDEVTRVVKDVKLTEACDVHEVLKPLLTNEKIFGVNLYDACLNGMIEAYFNEMIQGKGAVCKALHQFVSGETL